MGRFFLTESERQDISNQYNEIDRGMLNFLLRRYKVELKKLGDDEYPINLNVVTFEGFPEHSFSSFNNKKQMERVILNLLEDAGKYTDEYDVSSLNTTRQTVLKTIRAFLNFILPKK